MIRRLIAGSLIALSATVHGATLNPPPISHTLVYIGTYTGAKSQGIYAARFDSQTGVLTTPELVAEAVNPTFLAVHPNHRFLYAVHEVATATSQSGPAVAAYAIDVATGRLTWLNTQSSGGAGPCHLVVDRLGQNVLVANYAGGSLAVLPIGADGRLGPATACVQHSGASVNPQRQTAPHAHGITLDAANHFAVCADLGLDQLLCYRFDSAQGTLTPNDPPAAAVQPGVGPRHFVFHPTGRYGYVINELVATITAFAYDATRGTLAELQTVATVPADFAGKNYPAEIVVHPNGKFLYGSNRGHDSLAVFAIDQPTGRLTWLEQSATLGKAPRNFAIDPTGQFLLVANQDSGTLVVFRLDPQTGHLTATGQTAVVGAPVCVLFVPN